MKYVFSVILLTTLFFCGCQTDSFHIKGDLHQTNASKAYLIHVNPVNNSVEVLDSSEVHEGHFSFKGSVSHTIACTVKIGRKTKINLLVENSIKLNEMEQIFIFGGYDNWRKEFTAQSYFINLSNRMYEKINYNFNDEKCDEFPCPRTYHTSNYDKENQIVYIYGGTDMNINHSRENNFQSVWAFYLIKKYWKKIEIINPNPLGVPRGHSSILFNNKLYIFGGVILFKKFQNKLFIIDLITKKIENIEYNNNGIIPKPIAFHSSVLIDIYWTVNKYYNTEVTSC